MKKLATKIHAKDAAIGIIGLGYVGNTFAHLIARKKFRVIGFDVNKEKVATITNERSPHLFATTNMSEITTCDIVIVCVQTPITKTKAPDLRFLKNAIQTICSYHSREQLIIIESSIGTGTTRQVVLPLLQKKGSKLGKDFFLAFSPERIDPGNTTYPLDKIPKIISGIEEKSLKLIQLFYKQIFSTVVPVSSVETAEMVKLVENSFRLINISFINELTEYSKSRGIHLWEVINAASTKPFGFLAHYPGPGIGGHCIPVDPFYLFDDAKKEGIILQLIKTAGKINDLQPVKVIKSAYEILDPTFVPLLSFPHFSQQQKMRSRPIAQKGGKSISGDKHVLLIGLTYKPDIDDIRESSSLKVWKLFEQDGWHVSYHDPYIPVFKKQNSQGLTSSVIRKQDLIVILTNHTTIDYKKLASYNKPILDTRNVFPKNVYPHVHYL